LGGSGSGVGGGGRSPGAVTVRDPLD
jgi:hypothetical protein